MKWIFNFACKKDFSGIEHSSKHALKNQTEEFDHFASKPCFVRNL